MRELALSGVEAAAGKYQKSIEWYLQNRCQETLDSVRCLRQHVAAQLVALLREEPHALAVSFKRAYYYWLRQQNVYNTKYRDKDPSDGKEELAYSVCLMRNGFFRFRKDGKFQIATVEDREQWQSC